MWGLWTWYKWIKSSAFIGGSQEILRQEKSSPVSIAFIYVAVNTRGNTWEIWSGCPWGAEIWNWKGWGRGLVFAVITMWFLNNNMHINMALFEFSLSVPAHILSANLDGSVFKAYLESYPFHYLHCCHLGLAANLSPGLLQCLCSGLWASSVLAPLQFGICTAPRESVTMQTKVWCCLAQKPEVVPWVTWTKSQSGCSPHPHTPLPWLIFLHHTYHLSPDISGVLHTHSVSCLFYIFCFLFSLFGVLSQEGDFFLFSIVFLEPRTVLGR